MQVNDAFSSKVALLAAEMVADGWRYGTFEDPESTLEPGVGVETAMMRAAYHVWGGPGWWRKSQRKATRCLQGIRWSILDDANEPLTPAAHMSLERLARGRWNELSADEVVLMLLFASYWLRGQRRARTGESGT